MPSTSSFKKLKRQENLLFMKQLVKSPKSLGSVMPSSPFLGDFIAGHIHLKEDEKVLELGPGTGRLTQAMLRANIKPEQIIVVELDLAMCSFLKDHLPGVTVIHGDATSLTTLLSKEEAQKIKVIVSGIPMITIPKDVQDKIVEESFDILKNVQGYFLQFTYGLTSSIPPKKFGLLAKKLGVVFMNFPPATVWKYEKTELCDTLKKGKLSTFKVTRRFLSAKTSLYKKKFQNLTK
ncbi:MAG TPA: rRNA adenine N-6-methyltransferase family protein [Alphaproteobacteria bacterium]|nr:rRNA adenine N-6-methyltransferase family protein [Alphaproteobacteria bacterium]